MASSGLYFNKKYDDFYDGTAIRVIDIFINSAKKYNNIQFKIYLNDINKQYVKCLNCIKKRKKLNIPNNLKIYISNEDKYDFISNIKNMDNFNKYSSKSLIIYDPYEVDFEWHKLEPILQLNADLLITHFFPNDPKRNMKTKNEKLIQRYEHAYEINFNEMKNIFESKKNSFDRNILFRNILHENLKKYSGKKFIAYAPIIIEKKLHVYDIICASYSNYAQELLKNTMYKFIKKLNLKFLQKNIISQSYLISVMKIYIKRKEVKEYLNTNFIMMNHISFLCLSQSLVEKNYQKMILTRD